MTNPYYSIEVRGDVLCAKLRKKTGLETDWKYLLDFSAAAQSMRNRPWGILSDMRDWPSDQTQVKDKRVLDDFDRRNQIAECWVVRDDKQAARLIPAIERHSAIKFTRVRTLDEARDWYKKQPLFFDDSLSWDNFRIDE
jgi:hypothetical protein